PGFPARLIQQLEIKVRVDVTDQNAGRGIGSYHGIGCNGDMASFEGYPPIAYYSLSGSQQPGVVALSAGRHPIYYRRVLSKATPGIAASNRLPTNTNRNQYSLEYLADMLGESPEELKFIPISFHTISWNGPGHYLAEIFRIGCQVAESYQELG